MDGIGTVEGVLLRAENPSHMRLESLLLRDGVVCNQLPLLNVPILPLMQSDTLVFTTEGIRSGCAKDLSTHDPPPTMANQILATCSTRARTMRSFSLRRL